MKADPVRATACSLGLMLVAAAGYLSAASAQLEQQNQPPTYPAPQQDNQAQAPTYPPQQLDQLLAPIALYPDPLLAQILMASTYPLEVVEAARWVQDPNNARLRGDQLDAALQQQNWDPSVKSLVPFPQILAMMDSRLDWTQALGNAFLAQQGDVMDSVQRLRAQAQAAGTLQSTPQATVSTEGQTIAIEPANPQLVYVPYYNPNAVYGGWGYPDYPPVYFPPPPNYGYVAGPGIYFGVGFGIVGALWGWDRWDWGHHDIRIDPDRYNRINNYVIVRDNRPRYTETTWRHDPAHRLGVPYSAPAVRQKFQPAAAAAADARRAFRGFDNQGGAPPVQRAPSAMGGAAPPAAPRPADQGRPAAGQPATGRQGPPPLGQPAGQAGRAGQGGAPAAAPPPQTTARTVTPPSPQRAPTGMALAPPRPAVQPAVAPPRPALAPPPPAVQRPLAPAFSSFGKGPDVHAQSQRGQTSRQSMTPAAAPRVAAPPPRAAAPPQHNAPAGAGQKGGGNVQQSH